MRGCERGKKKDPLSLSLSREGHGRPSTKTAVVPGAAFRVARLKKSRRLQGRRKQRERRKAPLRCAPTPPEGYGIQVSHYSSKKQELPYCGGGFPYVKTRVLVYCMNMNSCVNSSDVDFTDGEGQ